MSGTRLSQCRESGELERKVCCGSANAPKAWGQGRALGGEAAALPLCGSGAPRAPMGLFPLSGLAWRPRSENQPRNLAAACDTILFLELGVGRLRDSVILRGSAWLRGHPGSSSVLQGF